MCNYDLEKMLYYAVKGINEEIGEIAVKIKMLEDMVQTEEVREKILAYNDEFDELHEHYTAWMKLDDLLNPWEESELELDNS